MGLGIHAVASLRRKRAFGLMSSLAQPKAVVDAFLACAKRTPLIDVLRVTGEPHAPAIWLHPCAEPVFVEFKGENVAVSAKTSTTGAGYHAFVIDCLRKLEAALGLQWNWPDLDETTYSANGDFAKLQDAMLGFQRSIFRVVAERANSNGQTCFRISMPFDYAPVLADDECGTPMGVFRLNDVLAIGQGRASELESRLPDFFPWHEKGFGGPFYRGLALHALWNDVRWAKPLDGAEVRHIGKIMEWCAFAQRLCKLDALQKDAIAALNDILAGRMKDDFPNSIGLGFRRRNFFGRLPGGQWTVQVPGSLLPDTEDEGRTEVWWNGVMTVRGSTISAERKQPDPSAVSSKPEWKRTLSEDRDNKCWVLSANGEISPSPKTVEVCIVSVSFRDQSLQPLAEKIAESIKFVPQSSGNT